MSNKNYNYNMLHTTVDTTFHCLFEQSGTFKNTFKRLGYKAKDYDLFNDYEQTDVVTDLYEEIEKAYLGIKSIFSFIKPKDVILAFFPCTRFEDQANMLFLGNAFQMKNYTEEQKLNYDLYLHSQLSRNYEIITKLAIVCLRKNIPLVIENPKGTLHYLSRYWALKPKVIDDDRSRHGDYYKKPTQYWFLNCEPRSNVVNMSFEDVKRGCIEDTKDSEHENGRKVARSEIHPQYAEWFIRSYLIEQEEFSLS